MRPVAIAVLLALAVAACTASPETSRQDLPVFPRYDRDSGIRMTAMLFGRLVVRHTCLALDVLRPQDGDDDTPTYLVWQPEARIGRDARGIYVRDDSTGAVIRPGERVIGGCGGIASDMPPAGNGRDFEADPPGYVPRDRKWVNTQVTPDLPPACRGNYVAFHGFRVLPPGMRP